MVHFKIMVVCVAGIMLAAAFSCPFKEIHYIVYTLTTLIQGQSYQLFYSKLLCSTESILLYLFRTYTQTQRLILIMFKPSKKLLNLSRATIRKVTANKLKKNVTFCNYRKNKHAVKLVISTSHNRA